MDILKDLLSRRESFVQRGKVVAIDEHNVSVQLNGGVKQMPKGSLVVNTGDEVTVQGSQLVGRRRPAKNAGRIYSV